jgi:hypothetical protein
MNTPRTPDHSRSSFARTNTRTIGHRVTLLRSLLPGIRSVAEICGGDCSAQAEAYRCELGIERFLAVDIDPEIAAQNQQRGVPTLCADALDATAMGVLRECDVVFFGPPLSEACDGHRLLDFDEVRPGFSDFARMLLGVLSYDGLFVCIGPRTTDMGDIRKLHRVVKSERPDYGLTLIHHSFSNITSRGERTEPRCKYIELWFSAQLGDRWEVLENIEE